MNVNTNRLVFDNIQSVPTKKVEVQVNSLPKFKSKQNSSISSSTSINPLLGQSKNYQTTSQTSSLTFPNLKLSFYHKNYLLPFKFPVVYEPIVSASTNYKKM